MFAGIFSVPKFCCYANEIVTDKLLAIAASYDINVKTGSRARTEHTTCHRQWSVRLVCGHWSGRRAPQRVARILSRQEDLEARVAHTS